LYASQILLGALGVLAIYAAIVCAAALYFVGRRDA